MAIDFTTTLGDLVTQDPRRAMVFERYGIDYCCNGQRPLDTAVQEAGLDLDEVSAAIDIADPPPPAQWQQLELAALAHDIVDTHHAYLWEQMPELELLVNRVAGVHGENHPELMRVQEAYLQAIADLDQHLTREERVLFPAISKLEKAQAPVSFAFGTLSNPINQMLAEHDVVGDLFKEMNALTNGFTVPDDGCASYTAMLAGLKAMELDLHEHIHKENNILFPRVLELEKRVSAG
ncbi:MAG: iron-sulfur cluster repair di-iron protein [Dermatophilus congolensis]|nr:iron-sulfur cluster repair di-iron protein [Dermatophilus congolensis]